jgi:hypothetical protein
MAFFQFKSQQRNKRLPSFEPTRLTASAALAAIKYSRDRNQKPDHRVFGVKFEFMFCSYAAVSKLKLNNEAAVM